MNIGYIVPFYRTILNIVSIVKHLVHHPRLFCVPLYTQISAAVCGVKALCMLKLRDVDTSSWWTEAHSGVVSRHESYRLRSRWMAHDHGLHGIVLLGWFAEQYDFYYFIIVCAVVCSSSVVAAAWRYASESYIWTRSRPLLQVTSRPSSRPVEHLSLLTYYYYF